MQITLSTIILATLFEAHYVKYLDFMKIPEALC